MQSRIALNKCRKMLFDIKKLALYYFQATMHSAKN